jgi:hypothetical protein
MKTNKEITLENLKKVYEELPKLAETNPSIKADFDMSLYGVYYFLTKEQINECGTHGCGLGNSARVLDIVECDFKIEDGKFDYFSFGRRVFPSCYHFKEGARLSDTNRLWMFLFDAGWAKFQPTFKQFIERVKYAIDTNLEVNWGYQVESFKK